MNKAITEKKSYRIEGLMIWLIIGSITLIPWILTWRMYQSNQALIEKFVALQVENIDMARWEVIKQNGCTERFIPPVEK